jgi:hypothetical protein
MKNLLNKLFIVIFFLSIGKLTYSQKIDSVVYRHLRYYGKGIVPLKREIILYNDSTFQLTREFVNGTLYTSGYYSYCKEGVILNSFDFNNFWKAPTCIESRIVFIFFFIFLS